MMNPSMFLNITNTEYKINSNEMLMLESLLTTDYFKSLDKKDQTKQNFKDTFKKSMKEKIVILEKL